MGIDRVKERERKTVIFPEPDPYHAADGTTDAQTPAACLYIILAFISPQLLQSTPIPCMIFVKADEMQTARQKTCMMWILPPQAESNQWPPALSALSSGLSDAQSGRPASHYHLRPLDSSALNVMLHERTLSHAQIPPRLVCRPLSLSFTRTPASPPRSHNMFLPHAYHLRILKVSRRLRDPEQMKRKYGDRSSKRCK